MDEADYTDFEQRLFERGDFAGREVALTDSQADLLMSSGCYRRSSGFPWHAIHYRRSNSDGSCLHLVWQEGQPRIHRDAHDPHASPLSLLGHLTNEARTESVTTVAIAYAIVKLLAR